MSFLLILEFMSNRPKEMNVVSTKVLLLFFPLVCPFAPSISSQVTPRHVLHSQPHIIWHVLHLQPYIIWYVLHSQPHITCQVICYIPLYTPSLFITCITWTQNMLRHDKVKIKGANGQTAGKHRCSTFVLFAFISFGLFNIFRH